MEWIKFCDKLPEEGQNIAAIRLSYPAAFWIGKYLQSEQDLGEPLEYWFPLPSFPDRFHWEKND